MHSRCFHNGFFYLLFTPFTLKLNVPIFAYGLESYPIVPLENMMLSFSNIHFELFN